ncbi:flagellar export protein FliJ [Oryzomicrobium sp.]|uniref:flagellar export protein FliJ n=1 Tax=Oryzomicrobium sp. TaxID=1911578 RepID=UPI0025DD56A2|nr:flagellar export protein FliJ [Oryzomicrobium sp.]MCE1241888.1 flagellar export protein FliJ [Oryzomicrobium sp.]
MAKAASLQPLIALMQERVDDATRILGTLVSAEQDAKSKLQLLMQYREEYVTRFRNASSNGLSLTSLRNYQSFIDRIDQAIAQQRATVTTSEQRTAEGQDAWLQQRNKLKAIDTLYQQRQAGEQLRENKREQKFQDEFAARRSKPE